MFVFKEEGLISLPMRYEGPPKFCLICKRNLLNPTCCHRDGNSASNHFHGNIYYHFLCPRHHIGGWDAKRNKT